jgi:hypothetical protein
MNADVAYPALNSIAAELAMSAGSKAAKAIDGDTFAAVYEALLAQPPDFWSGAGQTELLMYQSVSSGTPEM